MLRNIQRCSFERAKDTLDLNRFCEDLACKIANETLRMLDEQFCDFGPDLLEAAIGG